MTMDARQSAPATLRNREPILQVLNTVLPTEGTVLEVASGTGEHGVFFAPHFPQLQWLPSDPNPDARASIAAWQQSYSGNNLHPPLALDVCDRPWPIETETFATVDLAQFPVSAIVNINMIHISPWE
ncbi:MAG: DUF938 domain-containing protein, partial [Kamptonema sp. SIO4C4]|nr:DUF938 domain-containing protein [Kamptonema sp. SIO4C4]